MPTRTLTVPEAADFLKVSTVVIRKRLRNGGLEGYKLEDGYHPWRVLLDVPESAIPEPQPEPDPPPMDPRLRLILAVDHYERARELLAREPNGSRHLAALQARRRLAEAGLLVLLRESRAVLHHAGRAYWCHDGELHRAESRSFRSQTP